MTLKELFSVQADLNKLKSLSIELANLEDFNPYRSNTISDMPKGSAGKTMIEWHVEEKERIEKSELRTIFRLYFIDDMSYPKVAMRLNQIFPKRKIKYTDENVKKRVQRYFENVPLCPEAKC